MKKGNNKEERIYLFVVENWGWLMEMIERKRDKRYIRIKIKNF
jgi:hypothetical protein